MGVAKKKNGFVLKEWAVICHALATGRQGFIARKGGLKDEGDAFAKPPRQFYLQATYFHENKKQIKPEYYPLFDEITTRPPPENELHLDYLATVSQTRQVTDERELLPISQKCLLTLDYLTKRFHYGQAPSLWIIELQVERLSPPLILPMKKEYRGCQSWFRL